MVDTLRLKSILLLHGQNQKDLANYLNISKQSLSQKLNNKRQFKLNEILKICKYLNINDVQEIFTIFLTLR